MKIFISADIEGTTGTTIWEETHTMSDPGKAAPHAHQMTLEVKAACEGAIAAGADEIVIKDAHGTGTNLDISLLPECVRVIRGWTGHPYSMVYGVDGSFDAAMFIGYHSAAGRCGSPLSHTYSGKTNRVLLNGRICSEFLLYSMACALEGVPAVLLTGDKMLCEDSAGLWPALKTVAVKEGFGGSTCCLNPALACEKIRAAAEMALAPGFDRSLCALPERYVLELRYKEVRDAVRSSFYPGCVLTDDTTVTLESGSLMDILRSVDFIF